MRPQMSLPRPSEADVETQPLLSTSQSYDPRDSSPEQRSARPTSIRSVPSTLRALLQATWPVSLLLAIVLAVMWALYLVTWVAPRALNPTPPSAEQRARDAEWVSGSPYWADRQACRWLSLCGVHHLRWDPPAIEGGGADERPRGGAGESGRGRERAGFRRPRAKVAGSKGAKQVPEYVLRHAPLVHLHSEESFWPASVEEHLRHMRPVNHTAPGSSNGDGGGSHALLNLTSLDSLDATHGGAVYLTSTEDVETRPAWLTSRDGLPSSTDGENMGRSTAPAVLVLVEKDTDDDGPVLDAFWFFFYSYNLGQTVLGVRFGNHVGDWEHCMVRFARGEPTAVFLSEHEGGQAYAWRALEKAAAAGNSNSSSQHSRPSGGGGGGGGGGDRPVVYSAVGSHAMYATAGSHPYVLPFGMLKDVTDEGPLWDPARNAWAYWHEPSGGEDESAFEPAAPIGGEVAPAPAGWLGFRGRWGDELYGLDDGRQWRLFNQYHYVNGPAGPADKHLGRNAMCPQSRCKVLDSLEAGRKRTWYT